MQVPALARFVLRRGFAPVVGAGAAEWDHTHVHDVAALLVRLVEAAAERLSSEAGTAQTKDEVFGPRAYYFCERGTHAWANLAAEIAQEAVRQGWLKEVVSKEVRMGKEDGVQGIGETWGLNSKGVGSRARKYLGWEPRGRSLEEEIPGAVEWEAKQLGLQKAV
ncbi:hypothetical protein VTK26DRAFT_3720 [Humicola hyalothermophila]